MELKDKRILITGGTKGLGKALAGEFVRRGAKVVITGRSAETAAGENAAALRMIRSDISNEKQTQAAAAQAEAMLGGLDIWVNNAGVWLPPAPLEEYPVERLRSMVEINLLGLIYATREAVLRMKRAKSGVILNIISTSALEGCAGQAVYCATKFGAAGFAKAVREEAAGFGVQVINVYPGGMQTSLFDEARPDQYASYMAPEAVAKKVLDNLSLAKPEQELVLRRPEA